MSTCHENCKQTKELYLRSYESACKGFDKTDKTSDGIIFHDMSKNIGQTTKINTHLVNFGQPYQGGPSNILMNKQKNRAR